MSEYFRILILEDNPVDAELVQFELQEAGLSFDARVVISKKDFVRELCEFSPDLILSDYDLPQYNGALALAEAKRRCPDTPFILVTGAVSEDRAIEILTQGAKDYVLKTRLNQRLVPAVRRSLAESEEHRARKQAEAELREAHRTLEERVKSRTAELEAEVAVREKMEEVLRENEQFLKDTQVVAQLGGWKANPETDYLVWTEGVNHLIEAPLDYKPGFNEGLKFFAPEYMPILQERLLHTLATNEPFLEECKLITPSGKQLWVEVRGLTSMNENEIAYVIGTIQDITRRKQIESALHESEEHLHAIVEQTPDHILMQDHDLRYQIVINPQLNLTVADMLGKTDYDILKREDAERITAIKKEVLETGNPVSLETSFLNPKGEAVFFEGVYVPKLGRTGRTDGLIGYFRNITERKRAEEALRKNEERLRLAQESANVGIWDWIVATGELDFTPELNQLYGLPPGTIKTYQDWRDRVHPDDIKRIESGRDEAIVKREPFELEFRGRHFSGEYRWISTKGGAIYNEEGKAIRVFGVNIDITPRKQAEEKVRESEDLFRIMANSIPQLAWIARADGFIFWYNQRWYEYTGTTPEQMEGWGWQSVHDPKVLPEVMERWKTAIATGEPFDMEFPLLGADQVFRPFLTRILPVKNDQGQVIQWCGTNTDLSERKRAEEELAMNEREFRLLAESMPQIVWITRADGRNTYFNQKWVDYTGLTLEESYGHGWNKPFHPDDRQRAWDAWQNAVLHNAPYLLQCRLRRFDGIYQWWLIHGVPVVDENGNIIKWYGTCTDINDLKLTEEILKESENRFRAVFEQAAVGVALVNTKTGQFVRINQKYCDFVGYSMQEMLQKSFMDITYYQDIQTNDDANAQLVEGNKREVSFEKRYLHKDGSLIWGKLTISPLWKSGEKPEIYLHIAIVEDITEHKQAETALRESEQLYRAIGESIDYGIWVCDSEGRNIYASDSFLKLVGITQEQCSSFGWGNVLHPDDADRTIAAWQECVRTGGTWDIEHRFRGVDGQWHSVLARGLPVRDEKGEVICWAGINLDINKLKKVESELKDRTQQLEAANKELESFSYSISHDLKAPLRAIEGFSRMLKKKHGSDFNEEVIRILDVILTNTEMTGSLIDALLAFSRVQQNIVSLSEIDMDKLANNVWDEIHELHQERELQVRIKKLLAGLGDKILIRQVLYNLFTNAVKFTRDRAPGVIELTSRVESDRIVYCLKDNGAGFDMAYYDKLFGVFQRLHSQEEYEGTGIGLAIAQRIIKRHGGQIWAEGKVDEGACFYFSLQAVVND